MAKIDFYVSSLDRFGALGLVLESQQKVLLRFPSGDRYSAQTVPHGELVAMVEEACGGQAAALASLRAGQRARFPYELGGKSFGVSVEPRGAVWRVEIGPGTAAERGSGAGTDAAATTAGRGGAEPLMTARGVVEVPPRSAAGEVRGPNEPTERPPRLVPPVTEAPRVSVATPVTPVIEVARAARGATSGGRGSRVERLLRQMAELGASDLHLSCGSPPYLRVGGDIKPLPGHGPLDEESLLPELLALAPPRNREEFEQRHDTDFAYPIPGVARFRANLFRDRRGPGAVFRAIPFQILSAAELGLPPAVLELCSLRKGLVLVTGPTGSGKSTTLAALVDHVNQTRSDHIITIEDPVEFLHENKRCLVNQREVHTHTGSFKDALRAALREDPDVVLVGELRDLETIAIAVETAETGHLVFGTLHTTTAPSTVDRVVDQFPPDRQEQIRLMLSESLRGVVAQTLCKKKGGGRVAAYEILIASPAVSNLIRERKTFQLPSLMQTGRGLGMVTLNDSLLDLVRRGVVEPREALLKAAQKAELRALLARDGITVDES